VDSGGNVPTLAAAARLGTGTPVDSGGSVPTTPAAQPAPAVLGSQRATLERDPTCLVTPVTVRTMRGNTFGGMQAPRWRRRRLAAGGLVASAALLGMQALVAPTQAGATVVGRGGQQSPRTAQPAATGSPRYLAFGSRVTAVGSGAKLPHVTPTPKGKRYVQLGVDVWWSKKKPYTTPAAELAESDAIIKDVVGYLHCNSVSIGFPLFNPSLTASDVTRGRTTPSPADLAILIRVAESTGLRVEIRPVLNIGRNHGWDGNLLPRDRHAFAMSYFYALKPYLEMAQQLRVPYFAYATEWLRLSQDPYYISWFAALRKLISIVYHGQYFYDDSGSQYLSHRDITPDNATAGLHTDSYFQVVEPDWAKTDQLEFWWYLYLNPLPALVRESTVFQEVGFDAISGGYIYPARSLNPPTDLRYLWMQGDWFSMVCNVAHHFNLAGVYFWRLNFNFDPATTKWNSPRLSGNDWVSRTGARHISDCFDTWYRWG
jgi:hypothetical protein